MSVSMPRLLHATAADLGVRPWGGARCSRCYAHLEDAHGNPRWDVVGYSEGMRMVCLGGCWRERPIVSRRVAS